MELHHLALSIKNANEVDSFYKKLLGFKQIRKFTIDTELAFLIFSRAQATTVYLMEGNDIRLELFLDTESKPNNFSHYCFSFPDREAFIKKAEKQHAELLRIPREDRELIFLKDASGNMFEIKEEIH
jgi:catechol 2,3-dioxygenase-like lactoylglutathione lyase family enzyme